MNIDKNPIDKMYKDKFGKHTLPVSNNLLQRIKTEIKAPPRKNVAAWHWFIPALVVLITGAGVAFYYFNTNYQTVDVQKSNASLTIAENVTTTLFANNNKTIKPSNLNSTSLQNNEINSTELNATRAADNRKEFINVTVSNPSVIKIKGNTQKQPVTHNQGVNNSESNKTSSIGKSKVISDKKNDESLNKNKNVDGNKNKTDSDATNTNKFLTDTNNKFWQTVDKKAMLNGTAIKGRTINNDDSEKETILNNSSSSRSDSTKTETKNLFVVIKKDSSMGAKKDTVYFANKGNATFEEPKQRHFFLGLEGGYSSANSMATINGNSPSDSPLLGTAQLITPIFGNNINTYNASLNLGFVSKKNLGITTGIGMSNGGEQYNTIKLTDSYDTVKYYSFDSTFLLHLDSVKTFFRKGEESKHATNHYCFLNVPLMLCYSIVSNDKLYVKPAVGVVFNYLLAADTHWSYIDSKGIREVSIYRSKDSYNLFTLAVRASLDVGLFYNKRFYFGIKPTYTFYFQSIYKNNWDVKPRMFDVNFNFGYRF